MSRALACLPTCGVRNCGPLLAASCCCGLAVQVRCRTKPQRMSEGPVTPLVPRWIDSLST